MAHESSVSKRRNPTPFGRAPLQDDHGYAYALRKDAHTKQEFSYIKHTGFFLLAFLGFMLIEGKGILGDYLIAVVSTGFGVLFALLAYKKSSMLHC